VNDETELRLTEKVLALHRDHPEDYAAIVGMIREGDGVDPEDQDFLVDYIRESRVRRAGKAREKSLRGGLTHDDVAVFRRHCEVLEGLSRRQQAD
jgi:hypothetical protein